MVREMGEDDNLPSTSSEKLSGVFVALLPAVRSMRIQCRAKRCREGEELFSVLAVHRPASVPFANLVLLKDRVLSMHSRTEEEYLVVVSGERDEGQPGVEWLPCVAEPFDIGQAPLRISSLARAPYPFLIKKWWGLMHESSHVRPVV